MARCPTILAFLSGESQGQRNLAGYSPWNCIESDMTEHTPTFLFPFINNRDKELNILGVVSLKCSTWTIILIKEVMFQEIGFPHFLGWGRRCRNSILNLSKQWQRDLK